MAMAQAVDQVLFIAPALLQHADAAACQLFAQAAGNVAQGAVGGGEHQCLAPQRAC